MAKRAVILSDDDGTLHLLRMVLETEGWDMTTGRTLAEVRSIIEQWADVVLVDLCIEGGGLVALRQLAAADSTVAAIAIGDAQSAGSDALFAGATAHLPEPFEVHQLVDILRSLARVGDQVVIDITKRLDQQGDLPWFASS
jgi:DNA-binding NtrC family response regulator